MAWGNVAARTLLARLSGNCGPGDGSWMYLGFYIVSLLTRPCGVVGVVRSYFMLIAL